MARGQIAKEKVINTIISAFGTDYAGTDGKKWYINALDGNEKVQIAISLTCPKTFFVNNNSEVSNPVITKEERQEIDDLIKQLGL